MAKLEKSALSEQIEGLLDSGAAIGFPMSRSKDDDEDNNKYKSSSQSDDDDDSDDDKN